MLHQDPHPDIFFLLNMQTNNQVLRDTDITSPPPDANVSKQRIVSIVASPNFALPLQTGNNSGQATTTRHPDISFHIYVPHKDSVTPTTTKIQSPPPNKDPLLLRHLRHRSTTSIVAQLLPRVTQHITPPRDLSEAPKMHNRRAPCFSERASTLCDGTGHGCVGKLWHGGGSVGVRKMAVMGENVWRWR